MQGERQISKLSRGMRGMAAAGALLAAAACEQETAKRVVTEPPRLVIQQTDKVIDASRRALRSFLDVMTPGTSCLSRLRRKGIRFVSLPDKATRRGCGYTNAVRVTAFGDVPLSRDVILRCPVAERVSDWLNKTVQPAAESLLATRVSKLMVSSGYRCRGSRGHRWGRKRWRLSQHAYANAFDIWGLEFANGRETRVRNDWKFNVARAQRKAQQEADKAEKLSRRARYKLARQVIELEKRRQTMVREVRLPEKKGDMAAFWRYISLSACNSFNKVFTPEYDRVHRHHIHFDLAPARLCGIDGEFRRPVKRRRLANRPK